MLCRKQSSVGHTPSRTERLFLDVTTVSISCADAADVGGRESVRVKPADPSLRTRTERLAHAVGVARRLLALHLETTDDPAPALLDAHRSLVHATRLLERTPKVAGSDRVNQRVESRRSPDGVDDLTRIRGIDVSALVRLSALGITRFDQIAAWHPEDVRVVGQALDLGRSFQNNGVIDQAKMLTAPPDTVASAFDDAVAGWSPRATHEVSNRTRLVPLTPMQVVELHAVLRKGPGKTELRSLAIYAPLIARSVHIPIEHHDIMDEVLWRPSPLMDTATPVTIDVPTPAVVEAPSFNAETTPVATADATVKSTPTVDDLVEEKPGETPADAATKPAHMVNLDRIAALDAEFATLGETPQIDELEHAVIIAPPVTTADPASPRNTLASVERRQWRTVSVDEADVTIQTRSARSARATPLLLPMSELPLQPKRTIFVAEPLPDAPSEVSEAAVVIVKRRSRDRAAPDLEFYRPTGTEPVPKNAERVEGELTS